MTVCNFNFKLINEQTTLAGGWSENSNETFYLFKVESNNESIYVLAESANKASNQAACLRNGNFSYDKQKDFKVSCEKLMIRGNSERVIFKEPEVILREPTLDDLKNNAECYFSTFSITKENYKDCHKEPLFEITNEGAILYGCETGYFKFCTVVEIVNE